MLLSPLIQARKRATASSADLDFASGLMFAFGADCTAEVRVEAHSVCLAAALGALSTPGTLRLPLPSGKLIAVRRGWVVEAGDWLYGALVAPRDVPLNQATQALYGELFSLVQDRNLYRVWNYVPGINQLTDGLENYRHFSVGRSMAFQAAYSDNATARMSAASAVGAVEGGPLALAFIAGRHPVQHIENPHQVPAWQYPERYGPRPPSFARATTVQTPAGMAWFISGTASIKGSETLHPGAIIPQMELTLDNLRALSAKMNLGAMLDRGATGVGARRHVQVYLRHAHDFSVARTFLEQNFLSAHDQVLYLHAPICRADLEFEMECTYLPEQR
ncbi:MAG: hypothetical protein SFY80_01060 [Verrucomicrobiota bacterium]|nr:hypothetical protein [Verrucomicrobiota bacterium]